MDVDLVYLTLGHLRRPGLVNVPKGTQESRWAGRDGGVGAGCRAAPAEAGF